MRLSPARICLAATALLALATASAPAGSGSVKWLDDVVREVVREAEVGGKLAARDARRSAATGGRLFIREGAEEGLESLVRRSDDLARAAGKPIAAAPAEALLNARFSRLVKPESELARTFATLAPAEKRLVVEMGETAQRLAARYPAPGQAEALIRELGVDGLASVRVYGDDVAETLAREGSAGVSVLRKTGRAGWDFFRTKVLPNKGKLAAAGVLGLYMADPDKFVDTAGRATAYAVQLFGKAGVDLAAAVGRHAVGGLGGMFGSFFAGLGIGPAAARTIGVALALLVAAASALVLFGAPVRWLFRPLGWLTRPFRRAAGAAR